MKEVFIDESPPSDSLSRLTLAGTGKTEGSAPLSTAGLRAWIEIDLDAIRANVTLLRAFAGDETDILAVVKADAYGHGLVPIARAALEAGAAWLGVATVTEGVLLRDAGIKAPIALLCAALPQEAVAIVHRGLTATVGDQTLLEALAQAANSCRKSVAIHLEIETGMGRSGVVPQEAVTLWQTAVALGLRVTGLTTHLADADGPGDDFSRKQMLSFLQTREELARRGAAFEVSHVSNSAAILRFPELRCSLIRPGLLLYGILPAIPALQGREQNQARETIENRKSKIENLPLQPALTLKARVATVRNLPAGHAISYGATYCLQRPSQVATVLIGYGDGYSRRLSNCGSILLHGRRAPILGRVCMDQTVVDVTDIPDVAPGDEAVCIGSQGTARISIEEVAGLIQTIEHEIPTGLTSRLPRLYKG